MILVGYHSAGSYRLYNPVNYKIIISRHVFVDEKSSWDWKVQSYVPMELGEDHIDEEQRSEKCVPQSENHINEEQRSEECDPQPKNLRSQRNRRLPLKLNDCQMIPDNMITIDGKLVHLATREPIPHQL